jgi:hypothetical protein
MRLDLGVLVRVELGMPPSRRSVSSARLRSAAVGGDAGPTDGRGGTLGAG